jgi:hypothetical protein
MKRINVLSAISAAALLGISSVALAQGTGTSPGSSSTPPGNTMQRQQTPDSGGSNGTMQNERGGGSMSGDRMSPSQSQGHTQGQAPGQGQGAQNEKGQKSNQAQERGPAGSKQPTQAQDQRQPAGKAQPNQAQDQHSPASKSQPSQAQDQRGPAGDKMGADAKGDKSGSTVGSAPAGGVNLTTEQRTEIRQTVLTANAPRATNVNFAVSVGTVVPRTVHVVEVPQTIVRIHPQWRGYRYFVVNDEIVIVEPRTLKIVAVLDV